MRLYFVYLQMVERLVNLGAGQRAVQGLLFHVREKWCGSVGSVIIKHILSLEPIPWVHRFGRGQSQKDMTAAGNPYLVGPIDLVEGVTEVLGDGTPLQHDRGPGGRVGPDHALADPKKNK